MTMTKFSNDDIKTIGKAFAVIAGRIDPDLMTYGDGPDCVGFEETKVWEAFCEAYPDEWEVVHKAMYDAARKLTL